MFSLFLIIHISYLCFSHSSVSSFNKLLMHVLVIFNSFLIENGLLSLLKDDFVQENGYKRSNPRENQKDKLEMSFCHVTVEGLHRDLTESNCSVEGGVRELAKCG